MSRPYCLSHSMVASLRSTGGRLLLAGGHFTLSGDYASTLLGMLPAIVHLRTEPDRTELRWSLDRMSQELRAQRAGRPFHRSASRSHDVGSSDTSSSGERFSKRRWLAVRSCRQAIVCGYASHARRSSTALDSANAGRTRWHVPNYFCVEIQRDGRLIGHGVPLALAYAAGWRQIEEFSRFSLRHSAGTWL
jgi:hypothetical protein